MDSFDIVRRVPPEPLPIRNERREESETLKNFFFIIKNGVINAFFQCVDAHALVINKLERIHVARSDNHVCDAFYFFSDSAEQVVCLKSLTFIHWDRECLKYLSRLIEL